MCLTAVSQVADPTLRPRWAKTNERTSAQPAVPTQPVTTSTSQDSQRKRKREIDETDPKLREYLQVMQQGAQASTADGVMAIEAPLARAPEEDDESGGEYDELPVVKKSKTQNVDDSSAVVQSVVDKIDETLVLTEADAQQDDVAEPPPPTSKVPTVSTDADDDEWLRARTSRVLDLVDADDLSQQKQQQQPAVARSAADRSTSPQPVAGNTPGSDGAAADVMDVDKAVVIPEAAADVETSASAGQEPSSRLFIRNLPYGATEDEVKDHFAIFGAVEEVCTHWTFKDHFFFFAVSLVMKLR